MKAYLITLLGAAVLAAAVGILAPEGSNGGVGRHVRLLSSLVVLCVIAAPLPRALAGIRSFSIGLSEKTADMEQSFGSRSQDALNGASHAYLAQALRANIAETFSLRQEEVTCAIRWEEGGERPASVTLILSGSARFHDPHELEQYVSDLLGCPCDTAIA